MSTIRITALASRSMERAEQFAARFGGRPVLGYETLLTMRDVEAVYISLPPGMHRQWITLALEAGKHVLSEKPLATTRSEAVELTTLATRKGLVLMENFAFLRHSQHATVRDVVLQGGIGHLRLFSAAFGFPPLDPANFRYKAELGGGALLDAGVYPLRAAQAFLGPDLEVVGAVLRFDEATGVDIAGAALLTSREGVDAQLAFGFERSYTSRYAIWGRRGELFVERAFTAPPGLRPVIHLAQQDRVERRTLPADDQFARMAEEFVRTVLEGQDSERHMDEVVTQAALVDDVRSRARRSGTDGR